MILQKMYIENLILISGKIVLTLGAPYDTIKTVRKHTIM